MKRLHPSLVVRVAGGRLASSAQSPCATPLPLLHPQSEANGNHWTLSHERNQK
jgi:hypothetical protein